MADWPGGPLCLGSYRLWVIRWSQHEAGHPGYLLPANANLPRGVLRGGTPGDFFRQDGEQEAWAVLADLETQTGLGTSDRTEPLSAPHFWNQSLCSGRGHRSAPVYIQPVPP